MLIYSKITALYLRYKNGSKLQAKIPTIPPIKG